MAELIEILKIAGPSAALFIFFVWRDYTRENRMSERIQKIEDYQREKLETMVVETTAVVRESIETHKELVTALNLRPCINNQIKR